MQERIIKDIAWRLYHFTERDRWFKNDVFKSSVGRTRSSGNPQPPPIVVPFGIASFNAFTFKRRVPRPIRFERYRCQEEMLHSIDSYAHHIFDTRTGKWFSSPTEFYLPLEEQMALPNMRGQLATWQLLSDQSYGVSVLLNAGLYQKAARSLELLLEGVGAAAQYEDPAFMVKFWRICLQMFTIDKHSNLGAFESLCAQLKGAKDDKSLVRKAVLKMVLALQQAEPEDVRDTIRIGFDKTLRTMTDLIGDENAMLLHMWSHYFRYFDKHHVCIDALLLKFDYVYHASRMIFPLDPEVEIAITYYYGYAAYYLGHGEWHARGRRMIATLHTLTRQGLAAVTSPVWTLSMLAFTLSARIEAQSRWKEDHISASMNTILEAITILERGDRECRIRAMMLSGVLANWMKKWGKQHDSKFLQLRKEQIQSYISE